MNNLILKVREWAKDVGITDNGTVDTQYEKMKEEVDELGVALDELKYASSSIEAAEAEESVLDELGDVLVTCITTAETLGVQLDNCLAKSLKKITKRKKSGKMVDGKFIKAEDL